MKALNSTPIIVFRTGQLGDIIVSLPAMLEVRKRHPSSSLILMSDQDPHSQFCSWELIRHLGWFEDSILYNSRVTGFVKIVNVLRALLQARRKGVQIIYYLSQDRRSQFKLCLDRLLFRIIAGIPNCYGFNAVKYPPKSALQLPKVRPDWERLVRVAKSGAPETGEDPFDFRLPIPNQAQADARHLMQEAGIRTDEPLVAIGPISKMQAKCWPLERFEELGRRLLKEFSTLQLLLVGSNKDREPCERLKQAWAERAFNLAGLSVLESAAVLMQCHLFIGNDSGAMHLAGSVGLPCAAIFSCRDYPGLWDPFGKENMIFRSEVDCCGCLLTVCRKNDILCLRKISADAVYEPIHRFLLHLSETPK